MVNRNYQRGRAFEYRVLFLLREMDYYIIRSYASKGVADLLAVSPRIEHPKMKEYGLILGESLFIQCKKTKAYKKTGGVGPEEMKSLARAAVRYNATVLIAHSPKRKIEFIRVVPNIEKVNKEQVQEEPHG